MLLIPVLVFALSLFSLSLPVFSASASTESSVSGSSLSSSYLIYDTDITGFPSNSVGLTANVGNQQGSSLCWAFATDTALETTIYKTGLANSATTTLNFSELDLAYNVFVVSRGWTSVGGGAFEIAYEYFASDSGPVDQQSWETSDLSAWQNDSTVVTYYENGLASNPATLSGYSALESYFFPSRETIEDEGTLNGDSVSTISANVLANRNAIKTHILQSGGVTASIYYNSTSYLSSNIYYCYNTTQSANHMVTLVGWDDNITYSLNGTTHTGAYIAQNSYGTSFGKGGFFYIMYDDEYVEDNVCGFTRVGENLSSDIVYDNMADSGYANQFVTFNSTHTTYYTSYYDYSSTVYSANIYSLDSTVANQYISRIKVPTVCVEGAVTNSQNVTTDYRNFDATTFKVYVIDGLSSNSQTALSANFSNKIAVVNPNATGDDEYTFTANQTGYYTIELNDGDIQLSGDYFAIIIEIDDGLLFYMQNNPNHNISNATFVSTSPSSSWAVYGVSSAGDEECVLPMIVQTQYDLQEMTYSTSGDQTFVYDGSVHNPTVSVTTPSTYDITYSIDGEDFSSSLPDIKNVKLVDGEVGFYTIYIKIEADYYVTVVTIVDITINPKTIIITPLPQSSVYGEAYVRPTATISGVISGEVYATSGVLSVDNFDQAGLNNVGTYNIIIGNFELKSNTTKGFILSNYTTSFVSGVKYSVTPRTLSIVPSALSKIYGTNDPTLTYSFSGQMGSQEPNVTATLVRESGENVGTYAISLYGDIADVSVADDEDSGFYASNYSVEFSANTVNFSITERTITILPRTSQSKIYGDDDPTLTFDTANVYGDETPAFSGALSRIAGEDAGNYQITLGTLDIVDNGTFLASNYSVTLSSTAVYFSIYSGTISDSFVADTTNIYDGETHFITPTADSSYTVRFSKVTSKTDSFNESTASTSNIGFVNCGTYYISFEFSKENYETSFQTAKITIVQRELVVSPQSSQSKVYGSQDAISLANYSGNVSGEIPAFSGSFARASGENVGDYLINSLGTLSIIDNGDFVVSNYSLTFDNSSGITFAITKATLTVTPDDSQTKIYGKDDPTLSFTSAGYFFTDTASFSGALSRQSGENVGTYAITIGTLELGETLEDNYTLSFDTATHTFEITKAPLILTLLNLKDDENNDLVNYYGEISFDTIGYEFEQGTDANYVLGDDLSLTFVCLDAYGNEISNTTLAGSYAITATSANSNYSVSVTSGTLYTITYRKYTVTFKIDEESIIKTKNGVTHFDTIGTLPDGISATPSIDGYTFLGWRKTTDGVNWTSVDDITTEVITANTTFKAKMELINYNINYFLNGGSLSSNAPLSFNITTTPLTLVEPTRTGYTFLGYFESSDFFGLNNNTHSANCHP
jgi:C1A family cysteine protease